LLSYDEKYIVATEDADEKVPLIMPAEKV